MQFDLFEVGNDVVFGSRSVVYTCSAEQNAKVVIQDGVMIADRYKSYTHSPTHLLTHTHSLTPTHSHPLTHTHAPSCQDASFCQARLCVSYRC